MRVDRPFFVPLAITVVAALTSVLLFVSALVSWLAEVFGSWAGKHKIPGSMQLLQFNGVDTLDSITTGNYQDILTEGGVGIRVSCKVQANGTYKVK